MKTLVAIVLVALLVSACRSGHAGSSSVGRFTDEEKHRLYSAAMAASDSPLDSEVFKDVCKEIGIFDVDSKPNDLYAGFVSEHITWGTSAESDRFRLEISSKDRAREYITRHLSK